MSRKKSRRPSWLKRDLIVGPYLKLVLDKLTLKREMARLDHWPQTVPDSGACTYSFETSQGNPVSIVYMGREEAAERDPAEVAGMLFHEAVHVWRYYCRFIGEDAPSEEFEAYGIQHLGQQLLASYRQQTAAKA